MSRRDDEHGGSFSASGNPFRRRPEDAGDSLETTNETPVDLAAVQADDTLLNMLGSSEAGRSSADAELARVLVAWRRDVDTEPFGELLDTDTAVAAINAGRRPARRRHPVLGPVAAAAAVLVIAFSGVGLVAKSAQPQDQLWSLTKVLYADYARSVETAQKVQTELNTINQDLAEGKTTPDQARVKLEQVRKQLAVVKEEQGSRELATQSKKLEAKLDAMPTPTTVTPSPAFPAPVTSDPAAGPAIPTPTSTTPPAEPPPVQPTTELSTPPPTPSQNPPVEPVPGSPGTSEPSPRASPPGDATGSTPPVTSPSG